MSSLIESALSLQQQKVDLQIDFLLLQLQLLLNSILFFSQPLFARSRLLQTLSNFKTPLND